MLENSKRSENEPKAEIRLNPQMITKVMDSIDQLLEDELLFFQTFPNGLRMALNEELLESNYPEIKPSELAEVIKFLTQYIHYSTCHKLEEFYAVFKGNSTEVEKNIATLRSHKHFGLLAFRALRNRNFMYGVIESHIKTIKLGHPEAIATEYYDISIPYIDGQGDTAYLRLELDQIELKSLIASLSKLLESEGV